MLRPVGGQGRAKRRARDRAQLSLTPARLCNPPLATFNWMGSKSSKATHTTPVKAKSSNHSQSPTGDHRQDSGPHRHQFRFWIRARSRLSNHALSYPSHGFSHATGNSSTRSTSLQDPWSGGSKLSQCRRRVPLATSWHIHASRSETMAALLSISNTLCGL